MTENRKYPIGGYAPGNYHCKCITCKIEFTGDKRAIQCEPCAKRAYIEGFGKLTVSHAIDLAKLLDLQEGFNVTVIDDETKIMYNLVLAIKNPDNSHNNE